MKEVKMGRRKAVSQEMTIGRSERGAPVVETSYYNSDLLTPMRDMPELEQIKNEMASYGNEEHQAVVKIQAAHRGNAARRDTRSKAEL